ncbi:carboxypeptidase-like regulatory domain-containing protein [Teredinibacter sp. KSP-S5-2]|uniref:carboxypeptidase-like regulatory domain-containing protein n=1 Tax=Teredinibacter sp. KSP-S5-2 TaxID=3034506 RepID=UPI00293413E1|nr:carboxypeptidase-like regulatory domain-containing protein [Teredinibacter sp. KSP-S5-2]WNO09772.1 carboxypeptidase-like regulatory domain-containing protein [Teredinibacter sp. KSP-S5-2]
MSENQSGILCLFSAISGQITLNGKPVEQAKVTRLSRKAYAQKELTDETQTDDNGYFTLPALFDKSHVGKVLPMEFSVPQVMYVHYQGTEYKIWSGVKRNPAENAESRGKPLVVQCELTDETRLIEVNGGPIFSMCTWDVEPDSPFIIPPPDDDET